MRGTWFTSLRVQIVLLMTLALLPLGAVAIYQTNRVESEAARTTELALLALTGRAAKEEELIIEGAFGVARFFGSLAEEFANDPSRCTEELSNFLALNPDYSFIGIIPVSGIMTCSSSGQTYDFSGHPDFEASIAEQQRVVTTNWTGPMGQQAVFVLAEPYEVNGEFAGFISISVPRDDLPDADSELSSLGLRELMTVDTGGEILTARGGLENAVEELPEDYDAAVLRAARGVAFEGYNQSGEPRTYTVVPIAGSPASVLASWYMDEGLGGRIGNYVQPAVFPILMWMASMSVAMMAIYTLVVRHVSRIRRRMDQFADTRSIEVDGRDILMPNELQELSENFDRMADDIVRDEAALEDTLREKNVLIKEVHHRVKNNLQLISSIMNMQIRTATQQETRSVLSRLQDRVLSLATIHRDLYQSQNGGLVDVGALVTEIVDKSYDVGESTAMQVSVETQIDRVWLYPDQAVPLSLLAAECMTNVMKYLGNKDGAPGWIKAKLTQKDKICTFHLSNSTGEDVERESTGLGAQLISAFAIQLGGQIDTTLDANEYHVKLTFKVADFMPDGRDF